MILFGSKTKALGGFINIIGFVGTVLEKKIKLWFIIRCELFMYIHFPIHWHVH